MRVVAALVGCLSLVALTGFTTQPFNSDSPEPEVVNSTAESDALRAAVLAFAVDNGASVETAELAINDQEVAAELIAELDIELGVDADIWIENSAGSQEIFVRTAEPLIADAASALATSDQTSITVIHESPITERSPRVQGDLEKIVRESTDGVQGMYVRVDDGSLVVETVDPPSEIDSQALAERTGFEMVVIEQVEEFSDSVAMRGGISLGSCTAGFTARYGSYVGIITAAHCGASLNAYGNTAGTGLSTPATRRILTHNANADIAFLSVASTNSVFATFFGSSTSSPTAHGGPQEMPQGATVCHRGKTTGWNCGAITSIAYRPTWSGACVTSPCNASFVQVRATQGPGDSGGPWVNGSSPVGIHKGGSATLSVYSKFSRVPSGVTLY
jgi:hypothetical protein